MRTRQNIVAKNKMAAANMRFGASGGVTSPKIRKKKNIFQR